jgi:hypothetical protein
MSDAVARAPTILLRRYFVKPGHWDDFLPMWREVVRVRLRFGFEVLFAFADREHDVFTWAIRHQDDIDAVHERYYKDPERMTLNGITDHLRSWEITKVDAVPLQA